MNNLKKIIITIIKQIIYALFLNSLKRYKKKNKIKFQLLSTPLKHITYLKLLKNIILFFFIELVISPNRNLNTKKYH